ncbi:MAG: response regulator [Terracidiphilus sp.]|jgi:DNA-binding NtrC family response regulator
MSGARHKDFIKTFILIPSSPLHNSGAIILGASTPAQRSQFMSLSNSERRIFVVDDEQIIASSVALILRHFGFDSCSFTDPVEALQAAMSKAPDLLITDIVMPGFSGIELAIKLRKICPGCKVLLFSGQAVTHKMFESVQANPADFEVLAKPIHPSALLKHVESELGPAS